MDHRYLTEREAIQIKGGPHEAEKRCTRGREKAAVAPSCPCANNACFVAALVLRLVVRRKKGRDCGRIRTGVGSRVHELVISQRGVLVRHEAIAILVV